MHSKRNQERIYLPMKLLPLHLESSKKWFSIINPFHDVPNISTNQREHTTLLLGKHSGNFSRYKTLCHQQIFMIFVNISMNTPSLISQTSVEANAFDLHMLQKKSKKYYSLLLRNHTHCRNEWMSEYSR